MKNWTFAHSLALFLILVVMPFGAWGAVSAGHALLAWLLILVLLTAFLLNAGHGVIGLWRGMLIDDRNVISLSRTQMALWTVIVLSAYLAAALWNPFVGIEGAILWAAQTRMRGKKTGISPGFVTPLLNIVKPASTGCYGV